MKSGYVAIAGRPNAGKSTLLNRVLGAQLSIVTPKAQTTRERVLGILTQPDKGQIVFMDTPGIHRAKEGGINAFMMQEVREALDAPSVVWYLIDPASGVQHEQAVLEVLRAALAGTEVPVHLLFNKSDIKEKTVASARLDKFSEELTAAAKTLGLNVASVRRVSAKQGSGIKDLLSDTWKELPEGPLYYPDQDQISDRPTRFFVAEKIREQLLLQLGDELPYCCAVEIETFDESSRVPRIEAVIHVERESQKGMVIGQKGIKIKQIGSAARGQVEEFLDQHVFLGLRVKVLKDWTRDAARLKQLGYNVPPRRKSS